MRRLILVILVSLLVFLIAGLSLACSKGSTTKTTQDSSQTSTAVSTSTTTSGASKPGGMPDIADMKSLPSYRLSIMTKMVEGFRLRSRLYEVRVGKGPESRTRLDGGCQRQGHRGIYKNRRQILDVDGDWPVWAGLNNHRRQHPRHQQYHPIWPARSNRCSRMWRIPKHVLIKRERKR